MSTTSDEGTKDSKRGVYSYMQLLSEWELSNTDTSWMEFARCRGADPNLFFAEPGVAWQEKHAEAKKYCSKCVVYKDCMKFSIDNQIDYGIWGGLSPTQRRIHWGKDVTDDGE